MKQEKEASISETLGAIHTAADSLLICFMEGRQALNKAPFIPDWEDLKRKISSETGYGNLLPQWSEWVDTELEEMYQTMAVRTALQTRFAADPVRFGLGFVDSVNGQIEGKQKVAANKVRIRWGLFCMAAVARGEAYGMMEQALGRRKSDSLGFITTNFENSIGPIAVVRGDREEDLTLVHEDIHFWQIHQGRDEYPFNPRQELRNPALLRLVHDEGVADGDLEICWQFINGLAGLARHKLNFELQAELWSRGEVHPGILEGLYPPFSAATTAMSNLLFHPDFVMPDEERIRHSFEAGMRISELEYRSEFLNAVVQQALQERGKVKGIDPWDWVASRVCVLPIESNPALIKAVLLGRRVELTNVPKLDWTSPLGRTLAIFAARRVDPGIYSRSGHLQGEDIGRDSTLLTQIMVSRDLYRQIAEEYAMSEEDFEELKRWAIKMAIDFIPKGRRGKIEQRLKQEIHY